MVAGLAWFRQTAAGMAVVMLASLLVAGVRAEDAHATAVEGPRTDLRVDEPVPVTPLEPGGAGFVDPSADLVWDPAGGSTGLPGPSEVVFDLDRGSVAAAQGGPAPDVDDLPVTVRRVSRPGVPRSATSGRVRVEVLDAASARAAGVAGVLVRLAPEGSGSAELRVDYAGFADRFGGGWGSRLRVVELPACAVTTPEAPGCLEVTPRPSRNHPGSRVVSTRFRLDGAGPQVAGPSGGRLFAVAATAASEGAGDYRATDLSPAGSWSAGGSDGAFTYGYPLRLPPAAGPVPSVSLGYSSASPDGRTSGRNAQASWIGDGWGYAPGFVERSYAPCSLDEEGSSNPAVTGDLCWDGESASITMSLNGTNTTLVRDDSSGKWRAEADANWRIERLGSPASNSSSTSERWKITTTDGTQYFFGSQASASNSRWTVPVFGNHAGEPCRSGTFESSSCRQAYRWLLDKAVDVHGNLTRYVYATETGHYGAAGDRDNRVSYHRGGRLVRIEYGLRAGEGSVPATGRVVFTAGMRCLSDCGTASDPNVENWPDTPWDLDCDSAPCTTQLSPAFFSTKRLTKITTQVHDGSGFQAVDSWSLGHEFKDYGDAEQVTLWLKSIQHSGHVGGSVTLPKVQFGGEALPNRVDAAAGVPVMWRTRLSSIKTEAGAVITVDYRPTECAPGDLPASKHANPMRCYPVRWTPEFFTEPVEDWFHKHAVASVIETDTTGGSVAVETYYDYSTAGGGTTMLWAWDDTEFTEDEHRTYNQWRGYPQVTTRVGDPTGVQTRSRQRFHRGLDGQPLPSGGSRSVQVSDAEGNTAADHEALAGRVFESLSYDDAGVMGGSTFAYWTRKTATQARDHDGGDLQAWLSGVSVEKTRTRLVGSTWQRAETRTSFDPQGRAIEVNSLGDVSSSGDEYCTRTEYTDNNTAWIKNAVTRTETVSVGCGTTPSRPDDVVSETLTFFDGSESHGTAPVKGLPTRVDDLDDWDGGPVYVTTARMGFDALGRPVSTTDALDRTSTTAYTPAGPGPVTQTVSTNPAGHQTTTELEPAWGLPAAEVGPNGRRTDLAYDALGRSTAVWLPGRDQATQTASMQFDYLVRDDAPSAVVARELNHRQEYVTSIVLFDALLRKRQTQTETADRGRLVTETVYDTHGRVDEEFGPNHNVDPPDPSAIVRVREEDSARRIGYFYDAAGRVVDEMFYNKQVERWRTTTTYGGSSAGFMVAVSPPTGAPATATITDARGQTVEKRTYHSNTPSGVHDTLSYDYSPTGRMVGMTDPAGNQWSWDYDLRGRKASATDPDAGTSTMSYDAAGQLVSTTDARGQTVVTSYDELGRQTSRSDGGGTLLSEWEYDTARNGIGMLGKTTRWHDGNPYVKQIHAVNHQGLVAQTSVTLPASEGPLAGRHWFAQNYYPNGQVVFQGFLDAGDVEGGILQFTYDHVGNPTSQVFDGDLTGIHVIVDQATFTPFGEVQTRRLGASHERQAFQGFVYEEGTRRLERATFDRQASLHAVADLRYSYDDAGNLLSIADVPEDLPGNHELQCFQYDPRRRLAEAWAQGDTSGCAASPSMGVLGGPAPYWNSYQHDEAGNRTGETLRAPGQPETERTYTYPAAGQPQPHAVQQVTTTGSGEQMSFDYDPAGNTTSRQVDDRVQTLTWNAEGNLATVEEVGEDPMRMVYDTEGNRLIRDDGDTVTAYLPHTELTWDRGTGAVDGTRYFTHAGQVVAVCTGQDVADWTWMGVDHHGSTTTHAVNAFTAVEQVRRMDPYGNPRGTPPPAWPGQQGFAGGVEDPTGLVHVGARSYDPSIGRFVSIDPLLAVGDDQQINGYTYGRNNPLVWSDPNGLAPTSFACIDGDCSYHNPDGSARPKPKPDRHYFDSRRGPCIDYCGSPAENTLRREHGLSPWGRGGQTGPVEPGGQGVTRDDVAAWMFDDTYTSLPPTERAIVDERTFFYNNPKAASAIRDAQQVEFGANDQYGIGNELIGTADAHRCFAKGDIGGCAWLGIGLTPAKVFKLGKLFKLGEAAVTTARLCSFSGDTEVLMADGTTKPISKIEPGDEVLATNPETGEQTTEKVTAVWVHEDTLIDLQVLVPAGAREGSLQATTGATLATVSTTADHPFWNHTDQQWQPAHTLDPGDQLLTPEGATPTIAGLLPNTQHGATAYNLTVADHHTYYALVGSVPALVHNECSDAAYQGALHIQDEIARGNRNHVIPGIDMSDVDAIGAYIDRFISTPGTAITGGGKAWYDFERGVIIIQGSDWSTTAYQQTFDYFIRRTTK